MKKFKFVKIFIPSVIAETFSGWLKVKMISEMENMKYLIIDKA